MYVQPIIPRSSPASYALSTADSAARSPYRNAHSTHIHHQKGITKTSSRHVRRVKAAEVIDHDAAAAFFGVALPDFFGVVLLFAAVLACVLVFVTRPDFVFFKT